MVLSLSIRTDVYGKLNVFQNIFFINFLLVSFRFSYLYEVFMFRNNYIVEYKNRVNLID